MLPAEWSVPQSLISPLGTLALWTAQAARTAMCRSGAVGRGCGAAVHLGPGCRRATGRSCIRRSSTATSPGRPTPLQRRRSGGRRDPPDDARDAREASGGDPQQRRQVAVVADGLRRQPFDAEHPAARAGNGVGWPLKQVTFAVVSPLPYVVDATEVDTSLTSAVTATLTNIGSAGCYPVVEVNGPTSAFTLTKRRRVGLHGDPMSLVFDASRPGAAAIPGGRHVEFDFFRNTAYLDGSGTSYKPGIDIEASDSSRSCRARTISRSPARPRR